MERRKFYFIFPFHLTYLCPQLRSEFDEILLSHARTSHASIHELTRVTTINFLPSGRPISANWVHTPSAGKGNAGNTNSESETVTGTTTFDYLVDASGRAGILSTGYLKNR
jgi:flavine halogenase